MAIKKVFQCILPKLWKRKTALVKQFHKVFSFSCFAPLPVDGPLSDPSVVRPTGPNQMMNRMQNAAGLYLSLSLSHSLIHTHTQTHKDTHTHTPEHVSGAERWEFPLPAHVGVRSPRSTAQSYTRPLRSIPLPAHLQFHPAPVKSLHARSHLKFLCMPNTCRFQPKPYAWDTLSAWRTWSWFVALLLRKNPLHFYCCGAAVAVWLDRAPDTRIFRRQCGCSNLLT